MAITQNEALELGPINAYLADKTPEEIIGWAANEFDSDKIYSLTSAGLTAPLILDLLDRTASEGISPRISIIHNDTGFLPDQVYQYRDEILEPAFGFKSEVSGPEPETVEMISRQQLWSTNETLYRKLTKWDPLGKMIKEIGAQVLITGVRADQSENRQDLDILTHGADGELRLNPLFHFPKSEVPVRMEDLIESGRVARHPLHLVVDFVDDWPFIGGAKTECGINLASRLVVVPGSAESQ